jgi:hypothetical protein
MGARNGVLTKFNPSNRWPGELGQNPTSREVRSQIFG